MKINEANPQIRYTCLSVHVSVKSWSAQIKKKQTIIKKIIKYMFNEIYDNFMGMWFFLNYSTSSLWVVWTEPWLDQRILKELYLILYLCTCEHAMNP